MTAPDDPRTTSASPVQRAVWEDDVPLALFDSAPPAAAEPVRRTIQGTLSAVRRRHADGTVYDEDGVVSDALVADLADEGFWGLRADPAYGGAGTSFATYLDALTRVVAVNPWVGVLASMQAGLGPITTLNAFATPAQKSRLLPPLVRGERLGAYATTEPGTSSDLRAIRTTARRSGDELLLTGEKLLITNAAPGRTASVLCTVDGELRMLVVELPDREDDRFRTVRYGLRAFRHVHNRGLLLHDLPVPTDNLLPGSGLAIAYHALNHGRAAVAAGASGLLRRMTGSLIPWVRTRETFGVPIGDRELVQRRLGGLAARLVACDALAVWTAELLDQGYRGELEGVLAKVVGSELLKEATVDLLLKTHGGRALLEGNMFADEVHDLLAPTVYEGENEILTLGFFRALAREHAATVLDPVAQAMRPGPHRFRDTGRALRPYAGWLARRELRSAPTRLPRDVPLDLDEQAALALVLLQRSGLEISNAMRRHGARLADRQAVGLELAQRVQWATAMLVVSRYGIRQTDPLLRQAASCMAAELGRRLTGRRPSDRAWRELTVLGEAVAEERFAPVSEAPRTQPIMPAHLPS